MTAEPRKCTGRIFLPPSLKRLARMTHYNPAIVGELPATAQLVSLPSNLSDPLGNQAVGNCVPVAILKNLMSVSYTTGTEVKVTTSTAISFYSASTNPPYDPRTGWYDNGTVPTDALGVAISRGVDASGHNLIAYAPIDTSIPDQIRAGVAKFGGCILGFNLPASVEPAGVVVWDVHLPGDNTPGSFGGHEVFCYGYNARGVLLNSWGIPMLATWEFIANYAIDGDTLYWPQWLGSNGVSPAGADDAGSRYMLYGLGGPAAPAPPTPVVVVVVDPLDGYDS